MLGVTRTGELPSTLTDNMNASVNKELQGSMGNMLNSLSGRGVLNSSITGQGISRLGQQAADAYNKNYLTAYNSVLNGYGQALQSGQNNLSSILSAINTLGEMPSQAQENAYAGIMPAFNFWKTWQQLENSKPEMYDTVVTQKQSSCITPDTRVTLKNCNLIPVSELKDDDEIMCWDFDNGELTHAPLMAFYKEEDGEKEHDVIRVKFEDGSSVGVVVEHLFFDLTEGKFVAVNKDSMNYIGHEFAKVNDGMVHGVKVTEIAKDGTVAKTYAPQPEKHWNFLAEGFITGNDGQLGFVNRFNFNVNGMCYELRHNLDYPMYGITGYNRFKDLMSLHYYTRNRFGETQIAVSKGLIDFDEFYAYLTKFKHCFFDKWVNEGAR